MSPLCLLATDPPPQWTGLLIAAVTGLGGGGGLVALFNRRDAKKKDAAAARKQDAQADVSFEIANIKSLQDVQALFVQYNARLSADIQVVRERSDKAIAKLDRKLHLMGTAYHTLWGEYKLLRQYWRTLGIRLKGTDMEINPNEFPESGADLVDPFKLAEMMDKIDAEGSVYVFTSPTDPSKTTTLTTRKPDDQP